MNAVLKNTYTFFFIIFLSLNLLFSQTPENDVKARFLHKQHLFKIFSSKISDTEYDFPRNDFDAKCYKLDLEISFSPNVLKGKVTGRFEILKDGFEQVILDFDTALEITNVIGPVKSYSHQDKLLTIDLNQRFNTGEFIEITIEYNGVPDAGNNRWFVFDRLSDGSHHVWTLSEPYGAKYWWPCKDTPLDKADSVDIIVTVPENQIVAANGSLISDIVNGDGSRTFHWHESYPVATYLVSLAIAPYAHFTDKYNLNNDSDMLLDYYVYPQHEATARSIFPMVKDHLDGLIYYFGDYPFASEKYGMAQFGWGGGMEHQTISSIGVVSESWEFIYVHELAHQWFGDALTCASWQDIWLNEGFASYAEALYAEWAGFDNYAPGPDAYKAYINSQRFTGPGKLIVEDTTSIGNIFAPIVYDKGSWVLHMLRFVMGGSYFFEALKSYASEPGLRYASVNTEDFKNVCEQVSGYDLDTFFDQWLNYPYFPRYSYSMKPADNKFSGPNEVTVTILQEQAEPIYVMPVELQFTFSAGRDTTITVYNNLREQQYNIELDKTPVQLHFDPENRILREATDRSAGSYSTIKIENIYPNPANKDITIRLRSWNQGRHQMLVFDIAGKEINRLDAYYATTTHEYLFSWDRTNFSGKKVASGVYIFKPVFNLLQAGKAGKVVVIK